MPASEMLEPEQAVARWRDQIEENQRLQQTIVDRDRRIEDLARLNHQALFEAQRYQKLYNLTMDECGAWRHRAHTLEAQLDAIGMVVQDAARSLDSISDTALERAKAAPEPIRTDLPSLQRPIEDEPIDPPSFLRMPQSELHATPVPAMQGLG